MSIRKTSPSASSQCTLVIIVHHRQQMLPRITEYLSDFSGTVVITDSSPAAAPPHFIRAPNAQYVHCPGASYYKKIRDALAGATTDYAVICADDDFIVKGAVEDAVVIMNANPEISCVRGRTIRFTGVEARADIFAEWARHAKNVLFNKYERGRIWQLIGIMRWAVAMNYAVYRRKELGDIYNLMQSNRHLIPWLFCDRLIRYLAVCSGGIKFIPRPMSLRDDTRLLHDPALIPPELELETPYSALPGRLRDFGDPMAALMAQKLGNRDVSSIEKFNQKLFSRFFPSERINYAPHWLADRQPPELDTRHQLEIDEILTIVRRHRSLTDVIKAYMISAKNAARPVKRGAIRLLQFPARLFAGTAR